jgi:methionyl aminopeptidase
VIHGGHDGIQGKSVPIVKQHGDRKDTTRMEEGECFAIETFGSTGRGRVIEEGACSHYALTPEQPTNYTLRHQSAKNLLKSIHNNFGTLPFCRRYLEHVGEKNYLLGVSKECATVGQLLTLPFSSTNSCARTSSRRTRRSSTPSPEP